MCDYFLFAILYDDKMLMETIESDHPPMAPEDNCRLLDDRICLKNLYSKIASLPQVAEYLAANSSVKSGDVSNTDESAAAGYNHGDVPSEDQQGYGSIPCEGLAEQQQQPPSFEATNNNNMRPLTSASYEPPILQQPTFYPAMPWAATPQQEISYSYTPMPVAAVQPQQPQQPQYGNCLNDPRMMAVATHHGTAIMGASKMFSQQTQQPQQQLMHGMQPQQQQLSGGRGSAMWGLPIGGGGNPVRALPHFSQNNGNSGGSRSYFPPPPAAVHSKPFLPMVPTPALKMRSAVRESPKEGSTSSEAVSYEGEEHQFEMQ
eukprot:GHVS01004937.1.p1 GENE.GHVS01004937.1~~GHVS01004937.1.p1  ORF type:complete len:328 (-),score=70.23 GHVS01004937.1:778-1728(-)